MTPTLRLLSVTGAIAGLVLTGLGGWMLWKELRRGQWQGCVDLPSSVLCASTGPKRVREPYEQCIAFGSASLCAARPRRLWADWRLCFRTDRATSWEAAMDGCTRIIESRLETQTNVAIAYYRRGIARWVAGRSMVTPAARAVIADYDEAIRLRPKWGEVYLDRSHVHMMMGREKESFNDLNDAIRLLPKRTELLSERARRLKVQKRYDEAIADYTMLIRLNPDNRSALWERAVLRVLQKQWDKALADYEAIFRLRPDGRVLAKICGIKVALDRQIEAIADCERALTLPGLTLGDDLAIYADRGLARFALGDLEGARSDWLRIGDPPPHGSLEKLRSRYGLAMIREAEGDRAGAALEFTAIRASMNSQWYWTELETAMGRFRKH